MIGEARRTPTRATAWGGVVFALLYVVGVMMMFANSPSNKHHNNRVKFAADWSRYYADSGHRTATIAGAYVVAVAMIGIVVFGSHLRDRLAGSGAPAAGRLAFAGSILFASLTLAGAAAVAWIPGSVSFGDAPVPTGELAYLAPQLGFGALLLGGGAAAGLMLGAAGVGIARSRALPAWLGWVGLVFGVLVFAFGALFMPMVLLVLWVLVVAILGLRRPMPGAATA